jgi:PPOX class probable F420-dependent enzyme
VALIDDARIIEFLGQPRDAIIATLRSSGIPQLSPVWFLWHADRFVLSTGVATAKAANIRRDPRIGLCIDDEAGSRYFAASGRVIQVDDGWRRDYALKLIARYKPPEEVLPHWEYLERNEPQRVFTFDPERVIWRDYAGYGSEEGVPA